MIMKEISDKFRQWAKERGALSINQLEKDAGLPATTLAKVVSEKLKHNIPAKHWDRLEAVLRKYGWV